MNPITVLESEALVKENPSLVKETLDLYGSLSKAASALVCGPHKIEKLWNDAGKRMPLPGHLISAMDGLEQAGQAVRSEDDIERARAKKYEVFVKQQGEEVVHVMRDRATAEVVETSADKLDRACEPYEEARPGFTLFVGDLVTFYKFNGPTLKLRGEEPSFLAASPAPYYRWPRLVAWASIHGPTFYSPPAVGHGQSQPMRILAHVHILGSMPILQFIELQRTFYTVVNNWEQKISLKENIPIRQLGTATVKGKPFFSTVPKPPVSPSLYLYRTSGWSFDIPPPQDTKTALARLAASRAWRGEQEKGYSGFTRGHAAGGDFSDLRIQVCTLLSIMIPRLETSDTAVYVRTDALTAASYAHLDLVRRHAERPFKAKWYWVVSQEKGKLHFKGDWVTHTARDRKESCLFVDMISSELPSFESKTNVDQTWEQHFLDFLPDAPYICKRKIPPTLVSSYPCFSVGSMHAFDCIVASEGELMLAEVTVSDAENGELAFTHKRRLQPRIESAEDYYAMQAEDDRRKLCFYQWDLSVVYTGLMNLWTLPEQYSKSDLKNLVNLITFNAGGDVPLSSSFEEPSLALLDFGEPREEARVQDLRPPVPLVAQAPPVILELGGVPVVQRAGRRRVIDTD